MGAISKVLRLASDGEGSTELLFFCPGCNGIHGIYTARPAGHPGDTWGWNGNAEKPSFTPSLLIRSERWTPPVTPENLAEWRRAPWPQTKVQYVCHTFIGINGAEPGQIQFLGDCTHHLAGQTVDMVEKWAE